MKLVPKFRAGFAGIRSSSTAWFNILNGLVQYPRNHIFNVRYRAASFTGIHLAEKKFLDLALCNLIDL
jgi:hypothetical protein